MLVAAGPATASRACFEGVSLVRKAISGARLGSRGQSRFLTGRKNLDGQWSVESILTTL